MTQMLASLRLAEERKNYASSSEDEETISDADKGTLRTGIIAFNKIKASGFDQRDVTKLEFLNLFHTFKNFIVKAKKT